MTDVVVYFMGYGLHDIGFKKSNRSIGRTLLRVLSIFIRYLWSKTLAQYQGQTTVRSIFLPLAFLIKTESQQLRPLRQMMLECSKESSM